MIPAVCIWILSACLAFVAVDAEKRANEFTSLAATMAALCGVLLGAVYFAQALAAQGWQP